MHWKTILIIAIVGTIELAWLISNSVQLIKALFKVKPSEKKWARVRAEYVDDAVIYVYRGARYREEDLPEDASRDELTVYSKKLIVKYRYEGESYTAQIDGFTCDGKTAVIYCQRNNPAKAKELRPYSKSDVLDPAMTMLFIGALIFFEILAALGITGKLS